MPCSWFSSPSSFLFQTNNFEKFHVSPRSVSFPLCLYARNRHKNVTFITHNCFYLVNAWLVCRFSITIMSENEHKRAIANIWRKMTWKPKT
ncbi:hypothetical protein EC840_111107 [Rahnella sp. JUb53]|nr:hypothetical protein EC840_111107 [Rahnella sp. JUb53]